MAAVLAEVSGVEVVVVVVVIVDVVVVVVHFVVVLSDVVRRASGDVSTGSWRLCVLVLCSVPLPLRSILPSCAMLLHPCARNTRAGREVVVV